MEEEGMRGEEGESMKLIDLEILEGDGPSRVARRRVIQSVMNKTVRRDLPSPTHTQTLLLILLRFFRQFLRMHLVTCSGRVEVSDLSSRKRLSLNDFS